MAKKSTAGLTTLLVLGLVIPLGVANFVLNLVLTIFYYVPGLGEYLTADLDSALRIYLPLTLYLIALAFSIVVLVNKGNKEKTLAILGVVLNSVMVVSGLFYIATTYFL